MPANPAIRLITQIDGCEIRTSLLAHWITYSHVAKCAYVARLGVRRQAKLKAVALKSLTNELHGTRADLTAI